MPAKHQLGKPGKKKAERLKFKHAVVGGSWVDALQEVAEAHKAATILDVRTRPESRPAHPARPWVDNGVTTPIRRVFILQ